jgi:hypothetical protein
VSLSCSRCNRLWDRRAHSPSTRFPGSPISRPLPRLWLRCNSNPSMFPLQAVPCLCVLFISSPVCSPTGVGPWPSFTSSGAAVGSTAPSASNGCPKEGQCLVTGHPLLWNGPTRVCPETYLCRKCKPRFSSIPSFVHFIDADSRRQQHGLQHGLQGL